MSNNVVHNHNGIGFTGLLGVLFIGLKLTSVITWPWLWVLSPLWIPLAFVLIVLAAMLVTAIIAAIVETVKK